MKKIYIYKNGVAVNEEDSGHFANIDGEEPLEIIDATPENIKKYFPKQENSNSLKVVITNN